LPYASTATCSGRTCCPCSATSSRPWYQLDLIAVRGSVLDNLGLVLQRRPDFTQAVAHHQAGLAITRECGDLLDGLDRQAQARLRTALGGGRAD
jgi:hypothetical protein